MPNGRLEPKLSWNPIEGQPTAILGSTLSTNSAVNKVTYQNISLHTVI
jgi:hypothetical protein